MCVPCSANKWRIRESDLQAACLYIIFSNGYQTAFSFSACLHMSIGPLAEKHSAAAIAGMMCLSRGGRRARIWAGAVARAEVARLLHALLVLAALV